MQLNQASIPEGMKQKCEACIFVDALKLFSKKIFII